MKQKNILTGVGIIIVAVIILSFLFHKSFFQPSNQTSLNKSSTNQLTSTPTQLSSSTSSNSSAIFSSTTSPLAAPISFPRQRATKKFFGTEVSPGHSPVTPERFHGIHTGVDFEIFPGEETRDVPVFALCTGPLLLKETASGYGGVMSQKCTLGNEVVTIIYGHLRLTSIKADVGQTLETGQQIAVLGTGYSKETDGERKHLHLGIHQGPEVNLHGYVSTKDELKAWLNPLNYIK